MNSDLNEHKWAQGKLGDESLSLIIMGQSPSSEFYHPSPVGLPFYQGKADFGFIHPVAQSWCNNPLKIAEKNDILISVRAPVGANNIANEKCCIGRGLAAIRIKKPNSYLFFKYILDFKKTEIENLGTGTTFKSINKTTLYDFVVSVPPRDEQLRIAAILHKIQKAIEIENKLIQTTRELKKSTMKKLFSEGVNNGFMFDSNIFDQILDGNINIEKIQSRPKLFITHIQSDELDACKDDDRRTGLNKAFASVDMQGIPTESFVLGVSRLNMAKLGGGEIYEKIQRDNPNHICDALIGETCTKQNLTLITNDNDLRKKVVKLGGKAISFNDFKSGSWVKQKETEIGLVPESWEVCELEKYLLMAQYGLSIKGQKKANHPILRMNCQIDGRVVFRDLQYIDLDEGTFEKFKLSDGDLLFNRTNSHELVGRTAIFKGNRSAVFASYLIRLRLNLKFFYPEFINYFLNIEPVLNEVRKLASKGVSQSNISASKLKTFLIPRAPLEEQQEIAHILQTIDQKIEIHEKKKSTLQDLFKTMLHKLMTAEIRVHDLEIDTSEVV